ncbi:MAG: hypothetical protein ACYC54_13700 [Sedimentisphaerales bacterium]
MKLTKKFLIMFAIFCCVSCVSAIWAETYEVVRWQDGFESHTCGDYLMSYTGHELYPDIPGIVKPTNYWRVSGLDDLYTTIDCIKFSSGMKSVQQAWNGFDYANKGSVIVVFPEYYYRGTATGPHIMIRPGCTTVVETDVYLNYDAGNSQNNGEGQAVLVWHASTKPVAGWYSWAWGGVRYLSGPEYSSYTDSSLPAQPANRWYHFRTEVYDDFTYSVFMTPSGQSTQTVVSGASCQNAKTAPPYYNSDYLELRMLMAKGIIYWDNVKVSYIANNAQGFRDIYTIPVGVTIDGSLGANEWSGATEVAAKPLSGDGVFKSISTHSNVLLDPNKIIDVYSAYDSSNFYIAARFNKTDVNSTAYTGSFFQAVFTYEPNVSYVYGCSARAASGTTGHLSKFIGKQDPQYYTNWDPCNPGLNYSDFTSAGGQIVYSVVGDVMDIEMKIPFSEMPEFGGIIAGDKVNLQFNVTGMVFGSTVPQNRIPYTTNIGFEQYPWQYSNAEIGTPFGAGIAFPICGDADNQYPVGDITGPLGVPDCRVDFRDLALMAANWLAGQ